MTDRQFDSPKLKYVSPRMSSLSEEEVAAGLGPVLLSGSQTIEPATSLGAAMKYAGSDPADLIQTTPDK